jgi:hypothetical protein
MAGKRIRFVMRDIISVREISIPRAAVPPNSDTEKMANPKNKMVTV